MGIAFMVESQEQGNKLLHMVAKTTAKDLCVTEQAWVKPKNGQIHLHAALQHLQQAQEELQEAIHNKRGNSQEALQLADVINDVKRGMQAEEYHSETFVPFSIGSGIGWSCEVQ